MDALVHQPHADYLEAWQCIGCGKLEAPRPCIGVCKDRKLRLVDAVQHEAALAELAQVRRQAQRQRALIERLARTTPRSGQWERSYSALQGEARKLLATPPEPGLG